MKGRPGLLFIFFICVCLVVFYFSWQKLMSPRFDARERQSVIQEGSSFPRSNVEKWKFRQHFENLQQNKQSPYMVRENQVKMPSNREEDLADKKSSNLDKINFLDRSGNSRNWDKNIPHNDIDRLATKLRKKEELQSKPESVVSAPIAQRAQSINENKFLLDPIKSIQQHLNTMERFVHLDLKGAVPSMKYLKEIIPLFETLGATGLLVEYEDMFPFSGPLEPLKAANAFTREQLNEFLQTAKKHHLKVMPLVQTFGHMEFVLKSAFPELRESSYTPQVIDMTNNRSYEVISAMVQQVLVAHPDVTHLHIGCDEVYELGKGASATVMQEKKLTVDQMFLQHVKRVAQMVSTYQHREVVPVMWDDMLRKISEEDIVRSSLPSQVEIMVWHYTPNVTQKVGHENFEKYGRLFKAIWIASSFKGATGSRQFYTEPLYHLKNHISWLEAIEQHQSSLFFKGVALTGWQRYDHFATLCELLPVALPSLAVCLATLKNAGFTKEIYESTSKILKCDDNIQMTFPDIDKKTNQAIITQDCRFPGSDVYYAMQGFYGYTQIPTQHRLEGWLSDYQIAHGFSSPGQLKVLAMSLNKQNNGYTRLTGPLKLHLGSIFSPEDVEEWLEENIFERKRHNLELLDKVNNMLNIKVWHRRPLPTIKIERPDIPKQSKSNFSNVGVEPKLQKDSRLGAIRDVSRSEQTMNSLDTRGRRTEGDLNNQARLAQSPIASLQKEKPRSYLGNNNQQFESRVEKKYARSGRKEMRIPPQRMENENAKLPVQDVGVKRSLSKDYVRQSVNEDLSKHTYLGNRIRPVDTKDNSVRKPEVNKFNSQDNIKESRMVTQTKEQSNLNRNLRLQENQRIERVPNSDGIVQSMPRQREIENHRGSSLAETSLDKREQFESYAKKRQPILGKSDLSDFHDEKMERYEEKLFNSHT
ncbi:hexosaminidase D [Elysia marginata]|uniref:beta-N-acetylhexosaminidase n=1 Tax=Elysia marginata TaxID=1093978 RepID=A0AAV4I6R1_9GAST|nr:hexosaminidase D [Elysia marginata]